MFSGVGSCWLKETIRENQFASEMWKNLNVVDFNFQSGSWVWCLDKQASISSSLEPGMDFCNAKLSDLDGLIQ